MRTDEVASHLRGSRSCDPPELAAVHTVVPKDGILAIPLTDKEKPQKLQHIMNNNGFYLLNIPLCVGSALMTLGTIYGFIWPGGPILWGLIGFAVGNIVGFLCELAFQWRKIQLIRRRNKGPDVFLVIHCPKQIMPLVKEILFEYNALAISELDIEQKKHEREDFVILVNYNAPYI